MWIFCELPLSGGRFAYVIVELEVGRVGVRHADHARGAYSHPYAFRFF